MSPQAVARLALDALGGDTRAATRALAVGDPESGLDANAVGDEHLVDEKWGPSIGIWQIRSLHSHTGTGKTRDRRRLRDPAFNAQSMAEISGGGSDFSAWSTWPQPAKDNLPWAREIVAGVVGDTVPAEDGPPPTQPGGASPEAGMSGWRRGVLFLTGVAAVGVGGVFLFGDDIVSVVNPL